MALPIFFATDLQRGSIILDEDTSKHITGVLRMKNGEQLRLADGEGIIAVATITDDNRKRTTVQVQRREHHRQPLRTAIAISLLKNNTRFEWFLEKATEIGITEIIPLICARTEKEKFRKERLQQILVSAMLQSQQSWLPVLHDPIDFDKAIGFDFGEKFIAHCEVNEKKDLLAARQNRESTSIIFIGPEGDFTPAEISAALEKSFIPVSLGNTRLRTETAGMVAATLLKNG